MLLYDPIYGYVKITNFIHQFLVADEFQRLKGIKQLGLCYLFYPRATHTRLEHSIGVMHVTMKMMDEIIKNSSEELITKREYELICVAAIYHDIGHSAFSHMFDSFLELYLNRKDLPLFFQYNKHEDRSIYLLRKVNERIKALTEDEIIFIQHVIFGIPQIGKKIFLYQLVSNSTIDSDRIDYITRDGYYTYFHRYNFISLIKGITIKNDKICYDRSRYSDIQRFIKIRKQMYNRIYLNPLLMKLNKDIALRMTKLGREVFKYGEKIKDSDIILLLNLSEVDEIEDINTFDYKQNDIKNIDVNEIVFN